MDKAVQAYNDFQSTYKGDALGENLPLTMGSMFLDPKINQADKAIDYLEQEYKLYPKSPLVNDALGQEAGALIALQRFDDALSKYQKFLATNPPKEQAAQSELGIAQIYQSTGKLPDAIKQYQKVATTYDGMAAAETAAFYAAGLQVQADTKGSLPLLQAFVKKYPDGKYTPQATMMIGQVQDALGQSADAMATYKDIAAKFSKTDFGPQAFFAQAGMLGKEQKTDEMIGVLKDFIKAYHDSKDLFFAYDTIGQTQVSKGDVSGAIETYTEMATDHASQPKADAALYRVADLQRKQADALGQYLALSPDQRKKWTDEVNASVGTAEKVVQQFPDSDEVGLTLKTLLADQEMLAKAKLKSPEDIDKYFKDFAAKFDSNPAAKSHILFTLATYNYEKDPAKALAQMSEAYKPDLVYAPGDLDLYGQALIEAGKAQQAYDVYQKIGKDFPNPTTVGPTQAPQQIQEAQAMSLFGMGSALAKEGKTKESDDLFTQLKKLYPWSPKVIEANYGIAKSLFEQKKYDDAIRLLIPTVASRNAPAALRAKAFLLIGDIKADQNNVGAAIDNYLKMAFEYSGVTDLAPEGLWKGGQMLEKQAEMLNEQGTPKKSEQIAKAVNAYSTIVSKYPNSQYVKQAQDRLAVLPAAKK